ncbi:hypothetical protein PGT21_001321 [Puccinia graminis f. sp. tritici]|uniref:Uncharacterized protein n=1 Tax=Puccinia graminis f. sp. tritici TaxID=56615 RepID=A0A5B0NLZ2_PUCGR|nr:hypothetical protein PGT21_001321 [Puccinia graminis f. sp. tritici]
MIKLIDTHQNSEGRLMMGQSDGKEESIELRRKLNPRDQSAHLKQHESPSITLHSAYMQKKLPAQQFTSPHNIIRKKISITNTKDIAIPSFHLLTLQGHFIDKY